MTTTSAPDPGSFGVMVRNGHILTQTLPKPKSGPLPKVSVIIETRTGIEMVTKVGNVEVFGIKLDLLASDLQKIVCA